jgi:poly-gamma-glutamate capsule biosynthesis protein CapA/YwtB (metallophosphatase superfamily)
MAARRNGRFVDGCDANRVARVVRSSIAAAVALATLLAAGCTSSPARRAPRAPATTTGAAGTSTVPRLPAAASGSRSAHQPVSAAPAATRPPGVFTMAFAGDVHFAGRIAPRLAHDPATVFGEAEGQLGRADLTMVNLETAITTGGQQQNKEFTFRAPPSALTALRDAGIDVATMANNHGADYGLPGLHDTFRAIDRSGFPVIGIGPDARAAFRPYVTTLGGRRVAIFAADQVRDETTLPLFSAGVHKAGVANAYRPRLVRAVRRAAKAGDVVVVYVHWGIEYDTCASGEQQSLASNLADAGAAAVIGTHAHVLQGAGWLNNGTYVAYGLGNYLWWMSFGNNQDDNGVLTLRFADGRVAGARFAPSHLDERGVPRPADGAERRRILAEWRGVRSCAKLSAHPPG